MKKRKHYKVPKVIYVDMDGVLADFNNEPDGIHRFATEIGFFERLEPLKDNVATVKRLLADGNIVRILSISPNERADGEKIKWLKKFLPKLPKRNIIILRKGTSKATYASIDGILFDDYGRNIREWVAADGIGWKVRGDGDIAMGLDNLEWLW